MDDLDRYLEDLRLKDAVPAADLTARTLAACQTAHARLTERGGFLNRRRQLRLIAIPAAAFLAIGILIGAFLFAPPFITRRPADAYYTVDINPSIVLSVDKSGFVTQTSGQNEEAKTLLRSLDLTGKPVTQALRMIIEACRQAGYLHDEQRYVLVGYFADNSRDDQVIDALQASLEQEFGDLISLLLITGTLAEKQQADQLQVSPALLKLSRLASDLEMNEQVRLTDLIEEVGQAHMSELEAPAVTVSAHPQGVHLGWQELDFQAMGYTGKVSYQIMFAQTAQELEQFSGKLIDKLFFYTNQPQPLEYLIPSAALADYAGQTVYFAVFVRYHANLLVAGPITIWHVPADIIPAPTASPKPTKPPEPTVTAKPTPDAAVTPKPTPLPSPTAKPTKAPTATPKPTAAATGHQVYGKVLGDTIVLTWNKETAQNFSGYKIVASKTNPLPRYPDDGYLTYITNPQTTSLTLSAGQFGLKAETGYYFSVTWLYQDGSKIAGNAVYLVVPPVTTPTPAPYLASSISGSLDGSNASLSWVKISHSSFDGYKVMYSFTDPEPVYGDSSPYALWITDKYTVSCTLDVTKLSGYTAGGTIYFSISVLYDSHSVVVPGNVISFTAP